jgi:2'-5' RNA ligase
LGGIKHRVFFALCPDATVRARIAQAAGRMHRLTQGRRIPEQQLHLTLAFIGEVSDEDLKQLLSPPKDIFTPAFLLTLDEWGWWARKAVGWAGPSVVPAALRQLADNLHSWLRDAGFDLEARSFAAHVTLVRHGESVVLPKFSELIHWHVREFSLVNSLLTPEGARYNVLGKWLLQ